MRATIVNCTAHLGVSGEKTESLQVRFSKAEGIALQACQTLDPRIKVLDHMYNRPPNTSDEEAENKRVEEEEEAQHREVWLLWSNCPQKDRYQCTFAQRNWKPPSRALTTVGSMY